MASRILWILIMWIICKDIVIIVKLRLDSKDNMIRYNRNGSTSSRKKYHHMLTTSSLKMKWRRYSCIYWHNWKGIIVIISATFFSVYGIKRMVLDASRHCKESLQTLQEDIAGGLNIISISQASQASQEN